MCKRLGVRLTVKRNGKRVYKSVKVLKTQCKKKKKKIKKKRKVKRKRRRRFGSSYVTSNYVIVRDKEELDRKIAELPDEIYYKIFRYLFKNKHLVLLKDIKLKLEDYPPIRNRIHYNQKTNSKFLKQIPFWRLKNNRNNFIINPNNPRNYRVGSIYEIKFDNSLRDIKNTNELLDSISDGKYSPEFITDNFPGSKLVLRRIKKLKDAPRYISEKKKNQILLRKISPFTNPKFGKKKVKKKVKRKRKFGMAPPFIPRIINKGIYHSKVEEDGRIIIFYNDGSNYHGEFKLEDCGYGNFKIIKHGKGRLWKNGVIYDGEWENDRKKNYM